MEQIKLFFENSGLIITGIGTLITGFFGLLNLIRANISKKKDIEQKNEIIMKIEQSDIKQTKEISDIRKDITEIKSIIKDQPYANEIKSKINNVVNNNIKASQIKNSELKSCLFSGSDALGYLVDYLLSEDFFNKEISFDDLSFRDKSIYKLKEINSKIKIEKLNVQPCFIGSLKAISLNNTNILIKDLLEIKTGKYNGTSKQEFIKSFVNLADKMTSETIALYNNKQ
jgi:hypothetical protein